MRVQLFSMNGPVPTGCEVPKGLAKSGLAAVPVTLFASYFFRAVGLAIENVGRLRLKRNGADGALSFITAVSVFAAVQELYRLVLGEPGPG